MVKNKSNKNKPYIICHMLQSIDGRIDCAMTEKIDDTEHYYEVLDKLECDATIEGKTTLVMHYAEPGIFKDSMPYEAAGKQVYMVRQAHQPATESDAYAIGVDTKGTLLWGDDVEGQFGRPLIMILSEDASKEYLGYLQSKGISYITIGRGTIDLAAAISILGEQFGVKRLAVVGGGHLNGSFLDLGLIDEISMMYASGVDAREGLSASFDGRSKDREPIRLNLSSVERLDDIIWARYTIKN